MASTVTMSKRLFWLRQCHCAELQITGERKKNLLSYWWVRKLGNNTSQNKWCEKNNIKMDLDESLLVMPTGKKTSRSQW
jgi:hypothetical protein